MGGESGDSDSQGAISATKKLRTAPSLADTRQRIAASYAGTEREANGYVMTWDTTTRAVFDLTATLLEGYDADSGHFLRHVYASGQRRRWEAGRWVPLYHGLWYEKLPYANPEAMETAGLIEVKPHNTGEGLSAEYRIAPDVQMQLDSTLLDTLDESETVNLFTGNRTTKKQRTKLYDDSRNRYPDVVAFGMEGIKYAKVNYAAARAVVERRERVLQDAERAFTELAGVSLAEGSRHVNAARKDGLPLPYEGGR